jgi:hypothetical protein
VSDSTALTRPPSVATVSAEIGTLPLAARANARRMFAEHLEEHIRGIREIAFSSESDFIRLMAHRAMVAGAGAANGETYTRDEVNHCIAQQDELLRSLLDADTYDRVCEELREIWRMLK